MNFGPFGLPRFQRKDQGQWFFYWTFVLKYIFVDWAPHGGVQDCSSVNIWTWKLRSGKFMVISGISGQFGFAGLKKNTLKNFYEKKAVSRDFCRSEARGVERKVIQCSERSVSLALFVFFSNCKNWDRGEKVFVFSNVLFLLMKQKKRLLLNNSLKNHATSFQETWFLISWIYRKQWITTLMEEVKLLVMGKNERKYRDMSKTISF